MPRRKARRRNRPSQQKMSPAPDSLRANLKYYESVQLVGSPGALDNHIFAANDIRDVNVTGVGHQPMGMDEFMDFYEHFTVVGSKITAIFNNKDPNDALMCGVAIQPTAGVITDHQQMAENRTAKYKIIGAGQSDAITVTHKFSAKEYFGVRDLVAQSGYKGNVSTSPTELAYYSVFSGSADGSTQPDPNEVSVLIEFAVVFTEPKMLAKS